MKILTTPVGPASPTGQAGVHGVLRGLKFEPDPRGIGFAFHRASTEIGQKGAFCKGLGAATFRMSSKTSTSLKVGRGPRAWAWRSETKTMMYSLIIPARNEEMYIGRCLDAINACCVSSRQDVEVIVVLNRCTDATEDIARRHGAIIVRENSKNLSCIRNKGASVAKGEIIVTIDADSFMSANMLSEISLKLSSGRYIGGGVRILPERESPGIRATMLLINITMRLTGLSGGLYWCYRHDFEAIGGFNEGLFVAEDLDFARRLKIYGRRRGLRFTTLKSAYIVTSCRKFDRFGDWFVFNLILFRSREMFKSLRGVDHTLANRLFYDFDR